MVQRLNNRVCCPGENSPLPPVIPPGGDIHPIPRSSVRVPHTDEGEDGGGGRRRAPLFVPAAEGRAGVAPQVAHLFRWFRICGELQKSLAGPPRCAQEHLRQAPVGWRKSWRGETDPPPRWLSSGSLTQHPTVPPYNDRSGSLPHTHARAHTHTHAPLNK